MHYMEQKMNQNNKTEVQTPLLKTINDFMSLIKGFMVVVFIAYLFSGITLVKPEEIGIIMRMGKIVGQENVDQIHEPGWIFALPRPFDSVIKLPAKKVLQMEIKELAAKKNLHKDEEGNISTIDPTLEGYCITGDENIFQTSVIVKYQINDPLKMIFRFRTDIGAHEDLLYNLVVAEMTSVSCRFTIDGILTKDKKDLSEQVKTQVQKKLDDIESGLEIVSLEISEMMPPPFLAFDFEDVQSAYVDQHQFINKAKNLKATKLPEAQSNCEKQINDAMAYRENLLAKAESEAGKFEKMYKAYQQNPDEVSHEMKTNTIKSLITNSGNVILFPDEKAAKGNVSLLLGMNGSVQTNITTQNGYYESED